MSADCLVLLDEGALHGADWSGRHLKSVALTYARAPYFKACFPMYEDRF